MITRKLPALHRDPGGVATAQVAAMVAMALLTARLREVPGAGPEVALAPGTVAVHRLEAHVAEWVADEEDVI